MKLKHPFFYALTALVLLSATACAEMFKVASKPAQPWKIIPTEVQVSPWSEGWQWVSIEIALENTSGQFATPNIPTSNTILVTREGYTYPVTTVAHAVINKNATTLGPGANSISFVTPLPPGFRAVGYYVKGWSDTAYRFQAQIAQNTHVSKLSVPGYGDIDLQNLTRVTFPGGESYRNTRKLNEVLEIPGKARFAVVSFSKEGNRVYAGLWFENLNKGYNTTLDISFTLLSDDGVIIFPGEYVLGGRHECYPQLTANPAQTIVRKVCFLPYQGAKNMKLILTGDFNEVYDLGF